MLGMPFLDGHDLTLTKVVTWGQPERRLHYAAHVLATDLFTAPHAEDATPLLHALLCSLPPDQDWEMTRAELLERAFFKRTVEMDIQGRQVNLPLLGVPEDTCYLRVLIDTPLGWLEIYGPESEPEEDRAHLTPEQEAAGEAYLSLTPFPRLEGAQHEFSYRGLPALRAFAEEHGLVVEERPASIMLRADKTPAFRAFMADALAALGCDTPDGHAPVKSTPAYVPGEPVALADAVVFGKQARADLVGLTLELQRTEPRPAWSVDTRHPLLSVDLALPAYRTALRASVQAIYAAFSQSPELRVKQQLAEGRYKVGEHVLHFTRNQTCTVTTLDEYTKWREKRPYGAIHHHPDWVQAPEPQHLPERVNPDEDHPRRWPLGFDLSLF